MSRLRPADVVAGIGGLVLLGSLWLTWYGFDAEALIQTSGVAVPKDTGTLNLLNTFSGAHVPDFDAWHAFGILDIVLSAISLVAIGVPLTSAFAHGPAKPVAFTILGTVLSALAVLLILYRIVDQPGSNAIIAVKPGAWIGLAGAVVALIGSYAAMADERTPGAVAPNVPLRPAP